jgi:hypothetical protein
MAPRALPKWLVNCYYGLKFFPFRKERRERMINARSARNAGSA